MHDLLNKRTVVSVLPTPTGTAGGPVDFGATGDKFIYTPANPSDVYRWGLVNDTAMVSGTSFVMALDKRVTAGTDTGRVQMDTITRTTDMAAGTGLFSQSILPVAQAAGSDNRTTPPIPTYYNVEPAGPVQVNPGQQLVLEVTDAATSGTGYVWIEFVEYPIAGSRATALTEVTA